MTIRNLAQAEVERLLGRLAFEVRNALRHTTPDSVHDLRVAVRRFSQSLRIFQDALPAASAKKIRKQIRRVRDEASALRDADVMTELLTKLGLPPQHRLFNQLKRHRGEEEARLRDCLTALAQSDFSARWRALLRPTGTSMEDALAYAHGRLPRAAEEYFAEGHKLVAKTRTPEELHQFRITTKRFRYTLEMFQTLYGPIYAERLRRVQNVQGILGDVNDSFVAHQRLSQIDERNPLLAVLQQTAAEKETEFRGLWAKRFAPEDEKKRWVRYLATGGKGGAK